jgi:hypothetical protein
LKQVEIEQNGKKIELKARKSKCAPNEIIKEHFEEKTSPSVNFRHSDSLSHQQTTKRHREDPGKSPPEEDINNKAVFINNGSVSPKKVVKVSPRQRKAQKKRTSKRKALQQFYTSHLITDKAALCFEEAPATPVNDSIENTEQDKWLGKEDLKKSPPTITKKKKRPSVSKEEAVSGVDLDDVEMADSRNFVLSLPSQKEITPSLHQTFHLVNLDKKEENFPHVAVVRKKDERELLPAKVWITFLF